MSVARLKTGDLTLIFEVGTRILAILFRSPGSSFKQYREEVLIARSHSILAKREWKSVSAPVHPRQSRIPTPIG